MNIQSIIEKYFKPTKFKIISKNRQFIIHNVNNPNKECLIFRINTINKTITIDFLHKCVYNGNTILKKIKQIAKDINFYYIKLIDGSNIEYNKHKCDYNLSTYQILLKGQSWYNKYGFKSNNHSVQLKKWYKIRNTNFIKNIFNYSNNTKLNTFYNDNDNYYKKKVIIKKTKKYKKTIKSHKSIKYNLKSHYKNEYKILEFMNNYSLNILDSTKNVFKEFEKIRLKIRDKTELKYFNCHLNKIILLFDSNIKYNPYLKFKVI
tara:strand:+ start:1779 stop:2564 length:786 start_codon:yes stop_codon:yes gene_type:complete